jgi:hypothetical protein
VSFSQEIEEFNCVDKFESIETGIDSQKTISYKIISSKKLYTEESFEYSKGIIVINDLKEELSTKEIAKIFTTIGVENNLSEIIAFKTCRAIEIYFQNPEPTKQEIEYLEENLIIKLNLGINESLSKKERKKNKKKRDFIESVSIEICDNLSKYKNENFSQEKLLNAMVQKMSENVEKMMKVYDLSFEESSELFMKDLTFYLIDNCKIVSEFANRKD